MHAKDPATRLPNRFPRALRFALVIGLVLAAFALSACGEKQPARTFHEAFELLEEEAGVQGLELYGYTAIKMDSDGRSNEFTVTALDPVEGVLYALKGSPRNLRLSTLPAPDERTTAPLSTLRDTPDIVLEAEITYENTCPEGLSIGINLSEDRVDVLCMGKTKWGGTLSPYVEN